MAAEIMIEIDKLKLGKNMKAIHPEFKKALDRKFKKMRHFYLKVENKSVVVLIEDKYRNVFTPVGIIVLGLTQLDEMKCAIMMCSEEDQFSKEFAQREVYKRLYKLQQVYCINKNQKHDLAKIMSGSGKNFTCNLYFNYIDFDYYNICFEKEIKELRL